MEQRYQIIERKHSMWIRERTQKRLSTFKTEGIDISWDVAKIQSALVYRRIMQKSDVVRPKLETETYHSGIR